MNNEWRCQILKNPLATVQMNFQNSVLNLVTLTMSMIAILIIDIFTCYSC